MLTLEYSDLPNRNLAFNMTSHTKYIVTKVADFQSEKARTSTRSTKSPVILYFLLTSLLQNPYADTNNLYIVKAKKCKT